jgi:FkbM family methyltransferase
MSQPIIEHEFRGVKFLFAATPTAPALINEIFSDNYEVLSKKIEFGAGDIVLDLGANEGIFSIFIAKLFPQVRVVALEPVPRTFFNMIRNISLNGCQNIQAYNVGVGKPGLSKIQMFASQDGTNSGGSSAMFTFRDDWHIKQDVNLISLDDAFELYKIDRCRLLKIDIEGMEYDVLYGSTKLPLVDYMTAEFHMNRRLEFQSRRLDALAIWCHNQTNLIHVDACRMAE